MDNTIALLSSINSGVSRIAEMMAPQNKTAKDQTTVKNLNQGSIGAGVGAAVPKEKTSSIGGLSKSDIDMISSLGDALQKYKKISIIDVVKFEKIVKHITNALVHLAQSQGPIKTATTAGISMMIKALTQVRVAVKEAAKTAPLVPFALIGLYALRPVIRAYRALAMSLDGVLSYIVPALVASAALYLFSKALINLSLVGVIMIGSIMAIALLVKLGWKLILFGFASIAAIMIGVVAVGALAGLIASSVLPATAKSMLAIGGFFGMCAGLVLLCALVGAVTMLAWKAVIFGFAAISATMIGIVAVGRLAKRVAGQNRGSDLAIKNIVASFLMAAGVVLVSAIVGFVVTKKLDMCIAGFLAIGTVILAAVGTIAFADRVGKSKAVSSNSGHFSFGTMSGSNSGAIKNIVLSMMMAAGVVLAAMFVAKKLQKANLLALLGAFALITGVCLGAVGLMKLLSKIKVDKKGMLALAAIELLMLGAVGVSMLVVDLAERVKGKGPELLGAIALMVGLIVATGALTYAAGALVMGPQAALFDAGAAAMAVLEALLAGIIGVALLGVHLVDCLADLKVKMDSLSSNGLTGGEALAAFVNNDLGGVMKAINMKNLNPGLGVLEAAKLALKYAAIGAISGSILKIADALTALATIGNLMDNEGNVYPVTGKTESGELIVDRSRSVNLQNMSQCVSTALKSFASNLTMGFKDAAKFVVSAKAYEKILNIIDPISAFVEMVSSYDIDDDGNIAKVGFDEEGNVKIGAHVNIIAVSNKICSAVDGFVRTIFSEQNLEHWANLIQGAGGGRRRRKAAERMGNVLGTVIAPINEFIDMVTSLNVSADGTHLGKIELDDKGEQKQGAMVDVMKISTSIVGVLNNFINNIFANPLLEDAMDNAEDFDVTLITSPIETFVDTLRKIGENPEIGTKALDDMSNGVIRMMGTFGALMSDNANKQRINFSVSTNKVTKSLKDFDNEIINKSRRRTKAIKEMTDAIADLNKNMKNSSAGFAAMAKAVTGINNLDINRLNALKATFNQTAVDAMNKADKVVTSMTGGLGKEDLIDAITQLFDGAYFDADVKDERRRGDKTMKGLRLDLNGGKYKG